MGGYERDCAPWSLDDALGRPIPPDFNGRLLEEDWPRFEEIAVASKRRVPAMEDVKVTKLINGPEAFTPDNEFCLGETEVARLVRRRRLLRARAGGRGRHRQGDGRVDRRRRAADGPVAHGHPALRPASTARRPTRWSAPRRSTRPTTTSTTRARSVGRAPVEGVRRTTRGTPSTGRRSARSPAGSGSTGTSPTRRRGDAALRPRGWAGLHWSPAIDPARAQPHDRPRRPRHPARHGPVATGSRSSTTASSSQRAIPRPRPGKNPEGHRGLSRQGPGPCLSSTTSTSSTATSARCKACRSRSARAS